jgi:hypothetical protein
MMNNSKVVPNSTQDGNGSNKREAELEFLSRELADRELDLATRESKLSVFEERYAKTVGVLFAELDRLEKEIAQELFRLHPDEKYKEGFRRAKRKAENSQDAVNERIKQVEKPPFIPSEELRNLFRTVAKKIHPDFVTNEKKRAYRTLLMARANAAYKNGDMETLKQILYEWEHKDEKSFLEETQLIESDKLELKIRNIKMRIREIDAKIREMEKSELYQLMIKVERADLEGRDLLRDMATEIRSQILTAEERLGSLKQQAKD